MESENKNECESCGALEQWVKDKEILEDAGKDPCMTCGDRGKSNWIRK